MKILRYFLTLGLLLGAANAARAQLTVPGADGSDGTFAPTASVTIDLSLAPTGLWNGPNTSPANGVYDPEKWAVVFRYSSVNIPAGVTVTFKNHPSRAPLVWLVNGDVAIDGIVNLDGAGSSGAFGHFPEPGPGGWRGGTGAYIGRLGTGGFGPGGPFLNTDSNVKGGNHSTRGHGNSAQTYGSAMLLPLLGGSGGSGWTMGELSGGGGGGAIAVYSSGLIRISGTLTANGGFTGGGGGGGAGGAVRLVSDNFAFEGGRIQTLGAGGTRPGGNGRIRLEANHASGSVQVQPATEVVAPGNPAVVWPPSTAPTTRIVSIQAIPSPAEPVAGVTVGSDIQLNTDQPSEVVIETRNLDLAAAVWVNVNVINGVPYRVQATHQSGNTTLSIWTANISFAPEYYTVLQVHAVGP